MNNYKITSGHRSKTLLVSECQFSPLYRGKLTLTLIGVNDTNLTLIWHLPCPDYQHIIILIFFEKLVSIRLTLMTLMIISELRFMKNQKNINYGKS